MTTSNGAVAGLRAAGRGRLGIYIHIPFCARKCAYCDFVSFGGSTPEERRRYVTALCGEIAEYEGDGGPFYVDSVFIGGGTPSLLTPEQISLILSALKDVFLLAEDAEITMEANPGTLTEESLSGYRRAGVNRLSMGVQSLDAEVLALLSRIHDAETFFENFRAARRAGFSNINVDLMFGIPGQSFSSWEATLSGALSLCPEHLSFYSLQIEEGTPFYDWFASGRLAQPSEELDRRMYHETLRILRERGYRHYEISNAAKPGFECRHNLKYWSMEDYLGLGLAAHSYVKGVRFFNTEDLGAYLSGNRLAGVHRNDREDSLSDYLFTELRKTEGIDTEDFSRRFGEPVTQLFGEEIAGFCREGLLALSGGRLRFTERGLDYTNTVLRELMTGRAR